MSSEKVYKSRADIFAGVSEDETKNDAVIKNLLNTAMRHKTNRLFMEISPEVTMPRSVVITNDNRFIEKTSNILGSFNLNSYWSGYVIDYEDPYWNDEVCKLVKENDYSHVFLFGLPIEEIIKLYELNEDFLTVKFVVSADL